MDIISRILLSATLALAVAANAQDGAASQEPLTFTNDDLQQMPGYDAAEDEARSEEHKRAAELEEARREMEEKSAEARQGQPKGPGKMVTTADGRQAMAVSWPEGDAATRARLAGIQGQPAPPLNVAEWMNGDAVDLGNLGGNIVVLDFWATWCGPCLQSVPGMNELVQKYGDKGVIFVGVCGTRGAEKMKETAIRHDMKYRVCADIQGATTRSYAVDGYPDYYIVDYTGVVAMADVRADALETAIQAQIARRGRAAAEALSAQPAGR